MGLTDRHLDRRGGRLAGSRVGADTNTRELSGRAAGAADEATLGDAPPAGNHYAPLAEGEHRWVYTLFQRRFTPPTRR